MAVASLIASSAVFAVRLHSRVNICVDSTTIRLVSCSQHVLVAVPAAVSQLCA